MNLYRIAVQLGTGWGIGYIPIAPGTFASLAIAPIVLALAYFGMEAIFFFALAISLLGIPICDMASKELLKDDPKEVVWDEFSGMAWAGVAIVDDLRWIVPAFVIFRLLDIFKPGFKALERLPGGLGIMADDIFAGLITCGIILSLRWLLSFPLF